MNCAGKFTAFLMTVVTDIWMCCLLLLTKLT